MERCARLGRLCLYLKEISLPTLTDLQGKHFNRTLDACTWGEFPIKRCSNGQTELLCLAWPLRSYMGMA